jgi:hypothetical protein
LSPTVGSCDIVAANESGRAGNGDAAALPDFTASGAAAKPMHRAPSARRLVRATLRGGALAAAFLGLAGCSLLSIKTPETPLTPREQEARLLTRDYAEHFNGVMVRLIDDAATKDADPAVRSQALRLKLGVVTASTRAATGLSPIGSLLDTWGFALQLRDYLDSASGAALLGGAQPDVRAGVDALAVEADAMARKVTGDDYARYEVFVKHYAFRYPLEGPDCQRISVLSIWSAEGGDTAPLRAVGTVAQALGDVSDRMRIYGQEIPAVSLWQAQRELDRAGVDANSYRATFRSIDAQLAKISTLAETSPALAHEAIAELRRSLSESSDRLDNAWTQMLQTLRVERAALAANITSERESLTAAADIERERLAADAATIADRAVDKSWSELRKLVREALALLIVLALVVLGLPFAAGYFLGRQRAAATRDRS